MGICDYISTKVFTDEATVLGNPHNFTTPMDRGFAMLSNQN